MCSSFCVQLRKQKPFQVIKTKEESINCKCIQIAEETQPGDSNYRKLLLPLGLRESRTTFSHDATGVLFLQLLGLELSLLPWRATRCPQKPKIPLLKLYWLKPQHALLEPGLAPHCQSLIISLIFLSYILRKEPSWQLCCQKIWKTQFSKPVTQKTTKMMRLELRQYLDPQMESKEQALTHSSCYYQTYFHLLKSLG